MLRTAVVQMKEATCSPLRFSLPTIIYTFSQTYKLPPIRPTLTHCLRALTRARTSDVWWPLALRFFVSAAN